MIDRVERSHVGQQCLRGADVAGGLVAADVLLAGLQGHAISEIAGGVFRHSDDAPRHHPHQVLAHRHEGGVRAAIAKRHAEALRRADRDIGTHRASRSHQECGQWVDADRELAACGMQCVGKRCDIAQPTEGIRALHMRTEDGGGIEAVGVGHHHFDTHPAGARSDHRNHLRMHRSVDQETVGGVARGASQYAHRFCCRTGLVEQRGIGHRQAGQVDDHLLEIHQ